MNNLYVTTNIDYVKTLSKDYAQRNNLEWFGFKNNREDMNTIIDIYNNNDNCVIFLEGLNKSNVSNALLKVLEENKRNIHIYATCSSFDMSTACKARFTVIYTEDTFSFGEKFFKTKKATKEEYTNLFFYIDIANYVVDNKINLQENLSLINEIIKDIRLTTNNTPWDYYYHKLLKNMRW